MSQRSSLRKAARPRRRAARIRGTDSRYRRTLRYEPLEDRRLLAVVTVNTLGDTIDFNDGLTSLREAIFATNLVAGADEIQFAPSLTNGGPTTLTLTQSELKITDSLTITGPGAELLTIDAAEQSRIFNVTKSLSTDVTLSGVTLTRGRSLENGGAIVAVGHGLQLTNVFIANSTAKDGGAVAVVAGTLQVQGSTFAGNRAPNNSGGAIYTAGPTTIIDSNFVNNSSRTGGAIAAHHNLELNQTTVDHNSAVFGGGIWIGPNGRLFANGAIVRRNVSLDGLGGGIGGEGPITIVSSQILHNISSGHVGGGIGTRNHVTVENSVISGNKASSSGGGISTSGALVVRASTISGNGAGTLNGATASGGGIYLALGAGTPQATIESSTIFGNFAEGAGGGIGTRSSNRVINVLGSTISGNTARFGGGASGGQITLLHSTVTDNSAIFIRGDLGTIGGIRASVLTLDHTIVAGNHEARSGAPDLSGSVIARFSLIGDSKGTRLVEAPVGLADANGNLIGGPIHGAIDPLLGPLADYGGFELPDGSRILTHAPLPGSPAINRGDLNALAGVGGVPEFDQRGTPFGRVVNGRIDIGAFEYQAASDLNLLVDTLLDESDGNYIRGHLSLREAIALANLWPSTDTIRFDPTLAAGNTVPDPALVSGRILLTQGELKITDDVTIIGLGADLLTIDASGNDPTPSSTLHDGNRMNDGDGSRVFNVDDENGNLLDVSISGLTLTGGDVGGIVFARQGGAIRSWENLTVSDIAIGGNSAPDDGGGIHSRGGSLTMIASTVIGNSTSTNGGAIFLDGGFLSVTGSSFIGNSAHSGGALAVDGHATVTSSTISGNTAGPYGGAISNDGSLVVSSSTICDNAASGFGGGIWSSYSGILIVTSSTLSGNSASFGGAIEARNLTVINSTLSGNSAGFTGGGILADGAIVTNSTISGNSAGVSGGGIRTRRPNHLTVTNSTISGNSAGHQGGGINSVGGSLMVTSSTISGNSAVEGGGLFSQGDATLRHSTIAFNTTTGIGKGILVNSGSLSLDHSIVAQNTGTNEDINGLLGTTISAQYSLIGNNQGSGLAAAPVGLPDANGNLIGSSSMPINPLLSPLANYGGPTMTHALLPSSPAINAGDPTAVAGMNGVPEFDQRGTPFNRVVNGRIDIGAFESQPNPLAGDYNFNGLVDSGDYAVWRNTRGSTTDLRADGNGDGIVNDADRLVWMANFGNTVTAGSTELGAGSGVEIESRVEGQESRARVAAADPHLLDSSRPLLKGKLVFHHPTGRATIRSASIAATIAARHDDALLAWASRGQSQKRGRADLDAIARADYDAILGDGQECPSHGDTSGSSATVLDGLFASWPPNRPPTLSQISGNYVAHLIRG